MTDAETLYTAMHPTRLEILARVAIKSTYATALEDEIGIDRKIVAFHLAVLEKAGLVSSKFGLKNEPQTRPVAVKYYELTTKGKDAFERAKKALK
jgi:predicted transcriptional regulator